jgi:two-component system, NarL family, response regulator LiaR
MDRKIRVVIVDDHAMIRDGLERFLESLGYIELVGQASNGEEAIQVCLATKPDVVLIDLVMPKVDGVAAISAIHKASPDTRLIALTSFKEDEKVYAALRAGAINFLLKDVDYDELATAIQDAYAGKSAVKAEITHALIRMADKPSTHSFQLNPREVDVLRLIVHGQSNAQIANELHIAESTVKYHVGNVLSKLGVTTRTEAAAVAIQHNLLT